jgi:hypothetical protein
VGFRVDAVAAVKAVLDAYADANPTLLGQTYSARPESYTVPSTWLGARTEGSIRHDAQIRQRVVNIEVIVAHGLADNEEAMGREDVLIDALVDAFSDNPRRNPDFVIAPTSVESGEVPFGDGFTRAAVINVQASIQQGWS